MTLKGQISLFFEESTENCILEPRKPRSEDYQRVLLAVAIWIWNISIIYKVLYVFLVSNIPLQRNGTAAIPKTIKLFVSLKSILKIHILTFSVTIKFLGPTIMLRHFSTTWTSFSMNASISWKMNRLKMHGSCLD